MIRSVSLCFFLLIGLLDSSRADDVLNLVTLPDQYPFEFFHQSIRPELPYLPASDESALRLNLVTSNTYNIVDDAYLVDAESRELDAEFRFGLSDRITIVATSALRSIDGGFLDPFFNFVHRNLRTPMKPRSDARDNDFDISGVTSDGTPFALSRKSFGMTDLQLGARFVLLTESSELPQLTLATDLTLPTHLGTYGQRSVDTSVSLFAAKRISQFEMFAGGGGTLFGDRHEQGLEFDPLMLQGFAGFIVELSKRWSFQIDELAATTPTENVRGFPSWSTYLDVALIYQLSPHWSANALIREDLFFPKSTVDASFLFGLQYRWDSQP